MHANNAIVSFSQRLPTLVRVSDVMSKYSTFGIIGCLFFVHVSAKTIHEVFMPSSTCLTYTPPGTTYTIFVLVPD
jgi:hypothetical protein